jgi:hypothetical protein
VGIRIVTTDEDTLENDRVLDVCYCSAVPGDYKKLAYITSFSKIGACREYRWTAPHTRAGMVVVHMFAFGKKQEVPEMLETIVDRRRVAGDDKSVRPMHACREYRCVTHACR